MRLLIMLSLLLGTLQAMAQPPIHVNTKDQSDSSIVQSAIRVRGSGLNYVTDASGRASIIFPGNGTYKLVVRAIGFEDQIVDYDYSGKEDSLVIYLEREEEEMEEVIVRSTRISRSIANEPARVEMIEEEEIDEKNNMRPGNVAMLLHESTGIQVQQTSATSANAAIRIQGLDGRYTQLLKDGFPNFGNFSGGLSVLEIPPLDLQQVEIIKGPASTLYGAGSIAGVINFVSKTPGDKPVHNFIVNYSNIGQANIGGFTAMRTKKIGFTMLAMYNRQKAYDVDKDDFTELPKTSDYTLHPRLFFYPDERTTISIGNSYTSADRKGGDIFVIRGKPDASHQYVELNDTRRNISTLEINRDLADGKKLVLKQSLSRFDRTIELPGYVFKGKDITAYTDASFVANRETSALVTGINVMYNNFTDALIVARNEKNVTTGAYAQYTFRAARSVEIETGLRLDHLRYSNPGYTDDHFFVLPRISALFTITPSLTSRIGGGIGYKAPSLFTERTEVFQYRGLMPLTGVEPERSYGGTADLNYRGMLGMDVQFTVNQMFFLTTIQKPLLLTGSGIGVSFFNGEKPLVSAGFETNARFIYRKHLKLFLGYTYTDARSHSIPGKPFLPLVPAHKLNTALIYEKEGVVKLGLEGYFTGKQLLSNGLRTRPFKELGFMAEKIFSWFSVYINFENFTDTRQSRFKPVVSGDHLDPQFDEIWTHTEGFIFNGGIKIKL